MHGAEQPRQTVAIDARRLQDRPLTGAGRWLANLLPLLVQRTELVLLTDARRPGPMSPAPQHPLRIPSLLPEMLWLQVSAARWLGSFTGVFHGTFNALPVASRVPSVVTIFDLSFEHHPEDFSPAKRRLFAAQARLAARQAKAVITCSYHARLSLLETYRLPPAKVVVAPPSVDPMFSPHQTGRAGRLLERHGVAGRYVVAIGGARRRGLPTAIDAWRRARATLGEDIPLVVVGPCAGPPPDDVVALGPLDDPTWASVLSGAAVLCYPTRFEGFGMPALEAVASGVPVVCGRVGPLPEVLGEAAEWCDPQHPSSVAAALVRVLDDDERHHALRALGLSRASVAPSWADSAQTVLDTYRRAAAT